MKPKPAFHAMLEAINSAPARSSAQCDLFVLQTLAEADACPVTPGRLQVPAAFQWTVPGKVQVYNLDAFKASLSWTFTAAPLAIDTKLAKALDYFDHAQFLGKVRNDLLFGYPRAHGYLIADIFSNYYKAASVIVGDPSKDRDWQSR